MQVYNKSKKSGCPTCGGVDPESCMRCYASTRMCDWYLTDTGWTHKSELKDTELLPCKLCAREPYENVFYEDCQKNHEISCMTCNVTITELSKKKAEMTWNKLMAAQGDK